ncbi:hypothetical protein SCHPADRAFT_577719 [Schizopora paradoxa]|uniref:Uncharacterized protein n=1 Tax=Schizopora paradoxa TaxID=27342 RepID=A0A0H2RI72_9AGAM|nr:hypothetical protein SCHPADRAFT_577719 [Schizopora paradoxa]
MKLQDAMQSDLSKSFASLQRCLQEFIDEDIKTIKSVQKDQAQAYINTTVVATFLSGVTASMLQIVDPTNSGDSALAVAVNVSLFSSLVLSTASAVQSLLSITWMKSFVRLPEKTLPQVLHAWLHRGPVVSLLAAGALFAVGLVLFVYSSNQHLATSIITTSFASLQTIGVLGLTVLFYRERWRFRQEAGVTGRKLTKSSILFNAIDGLQHVFKFLARVLPSMLSAMRRVWATTTPHAIQVQNVELSGLRVDTRVDMSHESISSLQIAPFARPISIYTPSIGTSNNAFTPGGVARRRRNSLAQNLSPPPTTPARSTPLLPASERPPFFEPVLNDDLPQGNGNSDQVPDTAAYESNAGNSRDLDDNYLNLDLAFPIAPGWRQIDEVEESIGTGIGQLSTVTPPLPLGFGSPSAEQASHTPSPTSIPVALRTRPMFINRRVPESTAPFKLTRVALPEVSEAGDSAQRSPELIDFGETELEKRETPLVDLEDATTPDPEHVQLMIDPPNMGVDGSDRPLEDVPGDMRADQLSEAFTPDIRSSTSTPSSDELHIEEKEAVPEPLPLSPASTGSDSDSPVKSALKTADHAELASNKQVHFPQGLAQRSTNSSPSLTSLYDYGGAETDSWSGQRLNSTASRSRRSSAPLPMPQPPASTYPPYNAYMYQPQAPAAQMTPQYAPPSTSMPYPPTSFSASYTPSQMSYLPIQTPMSYPQSMPTYTTALVATPMSMPSVSPPVVTPYGSYAGTPMTYPGMNPYSYPPSFNPYAYRTPARSMTAMTDASLGYEELRHFNEPVPGYYY